MNIFDVLKPYGRRQSLEDLGLYVLPQAIPPRNSTVVDQIRSVLVPFGGAPTAAGFNYRVPANRRGVLRLLAVDTFEPAGIPFITFSVQRSGSPVPNYQNADIPLGTVGEPTWVWAEFDGDQIFEVTLVNSSLTTGYQTYVRAVLWFWDVLEMRGR